VAVALAVLGCGATISPAPAPAKLPRSFFGVVSIQPPAPEEYETMERGKVGNERFLVVWPGIQFTEGPCTATTGSKCDWSRVDPIVQGAAEHHVQLLPFLYGTPNWASGRHGALGQRYDPLQTTKGTNGWKHFVAAAVDRYGPDGAFWLEHPLVPKEPIRRWQIWNEQNLPIAYKPKPSVSKYARLLKVTSDVIRNHDPGAEIVLGGMFGTPAGKDGISAWKFLGKLYGIAGARASFDSVAVHAYAPGIHGVKYQVDRLRATILNHHDAKTPIWVTEVGWGSDAKHVHSRLVETPKRQKQLLVKAFDLFKAKRTHWNLAGITWFSWRDPTDPAGLCTFCLSSGLLKKNLDPKPSWSAFTRFTGGHP
jgi:hypothetical protein